MADKSPIRSPRVVRTPGKVKLPAAVPVVAEEHIPAALAATPPVAPAKPAVPAIAKGAVVAKPSDAPESIAVAPAQAAVAAPAMPAVDPVPAVSPDFSAPASTPPVPAPAPVAVADAPAVAPINEGTKTMATTAETVVNQTQNAATAATDKAQAFFADAQGQAKSAMEKSTKFYEELGAFTKGNVEALIASSKVAASAAETMSQDAVAYSKSSFEQLTATLKSLAAVKSPTELFQLQSDYARSAFDAAVAEGARTTEKLTKLAGEVAQPISSRLSLAAEKVKSAAL